MEILIRRFVTSHLIGICNVCSTVVSKEDHGVKRVKYIHSCFFFTWWVLFGSLLSRVKTPYKNGLNELIYYQILFFIFIDKAFKVANRKFIKMYKYTYFVHGSWRWPNMHKRLVVVSARTSILHVCCNVLLCFKCIQQCEIKSWITKKKGYR